MPVGDAQPRGDSGDVIGEDVFGCAGGQVDAAVAAFVAQLLGQALENLADAGGLHGLCSCRVVDWPGGR